MDNWGGSGSADGPLTNAKFDKPFGLAYDVRRRALYVADSANRVIRKVDFADLPDIPVSTFAGQLDSTTSTLEDGPATEALFSIPTALAVDQRTGDVWVGDTATGFLARISSDGVLKNMSIPALRDRRTAPGRVVLVDGPAFHAQYCSIRGMSFNLDHSKLYIIDAGMRCNSRTVIRELDLRSQIVTTRFGRLDRAFSGSFFTEHVDDEGRDAVLAEGANGIDVGADGMIYVNEACDQGGIIRRIDPATWSSQILLGDFEKSGCGDGSYNAGLILPSRDAPIPTTSYTLPADEAAVVERAFSGAGGDRMLFSARQSMGMMLLTFACGRYQSQRMPIPGDCADGLDADATVLGLSVMADTTVTIAANITSMSELNITRATLFIATGSLIVPALRIDGGSILRVLISSPTAGLVKVNGTLVLSRMRVVLFVASGYAFAEGQTYRLASYGLLQGQVDSTLVIIDPVPGRRLLEERKLGASTSCANGACLATVTSTKTRDIGLIVLVAVLGALTVGLAATLLYVLVIGPYIRATTDVKGRVQPV